MHVVILSYLCKYVAGEVKLDSHVEYKWVGVDELDKFDFLEGDYPVIEELLDYYLEERKDEEN